MACPHTCVGVGCEAIAAVQPPAGTGCTQRRARRVDKSFADLRRSAGLQQMRGRLASPRRRASQWGRRCRWLCIVHIRSDAHGATTAPHMQQAGGLGWMLGPRGRVQARHEDEAGRQGRGGGGKAAGCRQRRMRGETGNCKSIKHRLRATLRRTKTDEGSVASGGGCSRTPLAAKSPGCWARSGGLEAGLAFRAQQQGRTTYSAHTDRVGGVVTTRTPARHTDARVGRLQTPSGGSGDEKQTNEASDAF